MPTATIAALNVYPVKSCRGIALPRARVATRGLVAAVREARVADREWMIVTPGGRFVTQREVPRLALIETALAADALVLSAPGASPWALPLSDDGGAAVDVVVWRSQVRARDAGEAAARWLGAAMGVDLRLVRFDPDELRLCDPDYAGDSGAHTAFADGYPVLVIGAASLDDLNARLGASGVGRLPMNRFRPNIVLAGLDPYAEDHLDTIAAPGVVLKCVKPCTRCRVTTTDQRTAVVGAEPLATLAGYRMNAALGGVTFGMNAIVVAGEGSDIAIGAHADCTYAF